jgi:hypothetical protein
MLSLLEKVVRIFVNKLWITQLNGSDKLCLTRKVNRTLAFESKHLFPEIRNVTCWVSAKDLFKDWTLLCWVPFL